LGVSFLGAIINMNEAETRAELISQLSTQLVG
jgi:hypothetical protein